MKRAGITLCMLGTLLWATSSVAGTLSSENFEWLSEGSLHISGGAEGQYWVSEEAENGSMNDLAVVKAYEDGAAKPKDGGDQYLAVDTGAPLQRYVQGGGAALDVGAGIYFEGDVQFTPYDGETKVDAGTGDKLLVYLQVKESDDENGNVTATTNFVVKAAYYDEGNSVKETKDYVCAVPDGFDAAKWHHLVVKMKIRTNTDGYKRVFFEIAVDGSYLTSSESKGDAGSLAAGVANSLFPSLDTTTDNTEKMVSVGFKGQGSIDNVTWTDTDPIPGKVDYVAEVDGTGYETFDATLINAAENKTIKLLKDIVIAEGITIDKTTTLDLAGKTVSGSPDGAGVLAVESEGVTLTIEDTSGNGRVAYTGESEGYAVMVSDGTLVLGANGAENNFYIDGVVAATSSENLTVHGGYLKNKPTDGDTELDPPTGKVWQQITEGNKKGYYQLVEGEAPPATGPTVDNGGTVDSTTKTITVDTATNGTVTIEGDASSYTIEVPANVTTINGKVGTVTVKSGTVDISGAFKTTKSGDTTTIALNPDGSVTVNGKTIKVKPELVDASETEVPFAVAAGAATAKVKAIPGLTYVLKASTDVTKMAGATPVGESVVADGSGTVELKDSKASESTKFYVIEVTARPHRRSSM